MDRLLPVSNAIYVYAIQTSGSCSQEKRESKQKKSKVMDFLPSPEVDDINKKLIIPPKGLARAVTAV